ncbi:zinc-binding dehydrogenase [Lignipirellula cremea]|uniref:L-galactonate oxidoreductase n=1 Tax=Lignipirellula cremea TaxID=2528010 RepID=A0A518DSH2_9BACT|nr:zinc-binding dehydrogenase [Lignipirellula cremea]QDU94779.1 Putative L-galactonate oxidoreductase [Lignipirellula cremea]
MRAIAARPGSSEPYFVDAPEPPEPGPGEVLCRTLELGVCGTDREILASKQPWTPPGESHLVLGHECLARVEAVGDGVTLEVGSLVTPVVRRARPSADPGMRVDMLTFGDYVERGIVEEHGFSLPLWLDRPEHLFLVDPGLKPLAVFAEPLSVAEKAVNEAIRLQTARLTPETWSDPPPRVLVTGMGPIAFAAILAARCRNWPVVIYGRDADDSPRAQLAQELGAEYLPADRAAFDQHDSFTGGYDLVLECTGAEEVLLAAAHVLNARGVMVWLGADRVGRSRSLNLANAMRRAVVGNHLHLGSVNAAPRDFADALQHLAQMQASHPQPMAALISDRAPFHDALAQYQNRNKQGVKAIVQYEK